jgi:thiol:disulfide interchange protein DsbD
LTIVFLCCAAWLGSAAARAGAAPGSPLFTRQADAHFLEAEQVLRLDPARQQGAWFELQGRIAPAYHVYRQSLKLVDAQGRSIALDLPVGQLKNDEFFGETEVYEGEALRLRLPARAATAGPLTLHWQGCAQAGICYPPQTVALDLPPAVPAQEEAAAPQQAAPPALAQDQAAARRLATLGPLWGSLVFFGFGLLLAFTPCTLPMVPIISAMVVGHGVRPRRALALSASYVLAMAATYAAVGVAAGLAGANLQAALQSPWLLGAFAALFVVLASSLFGLFELRLPAALADRLGAAGQGRPGGSMAGAAAMGLLSALLVGPCMTAPLAGALLYIGQTGSAFQGGLALFALGLGMGLPLLAIAVFGARILPRPGAWMDRVRVAFGYLMLGMAVMMLSRFLPGAVGLLLWGAWGLALAVGLLAWAQAAARRLAWTLRSGAAVAGLWSALMLIGAAAGADSALQPLAPLRSAEAATATASAYSTPAARVRHVQAKSTQDVDALLAQAGARGQWSLIDFYADWCASCHVIERTVFGDPAVAARLARVQVIRPDVTANDAVDKALLRRWGVMGPPTLVFIGPDGAERRQLRVVGEISAREFLDRWNAADAL